MGENKNKKQKKDRPIQKFRLGALCINAWENESKQGNKFLNFSIEKRYLDGKDWKSTSSLNASDLKNVGMLCDMASKYAVSYDAKRQNKSSDPDDEDDESEEDDEEED